MNKVLIIAEAGINHNGDIEIAKKLINVASEAGADLVKFQTFTADQIATKDLKKVNYQKNNTGNNSSQYEMLSNLELSFSDHEELISHCKKKNINFFSTAFDIKSLDLLANLGQKLFKVPSGEITNLPYLRHICKLADSVIISSGMSTMDEIRSALNVFLVAGFSKKNIHILHCTTEYPAPFDEINLFAMQTIGKAFDVPIGYSDHTEGTEVSIAAVALGAQVIEKHFTLDKKLIGPDHKASIEPDELRFMIRSIRNIERALGDGEKIPTKSEEINKPNIRKSIVAKCTIKSGEIFTIENLTTKRPGIGISPMSWDLVIGSVANRDYKQDDLIEI